MCTLALVFVVITIGPAADASALAAARESIMSNELKRHVDVLADDTFEGREAGSRGGRAAAGYLVKELKRYGLKPAGTRGSYFQSFGQGYRNILGTLEGSDPVLKKQFIVIGAHYDHVGYGTAKNSYGPVGFIHNGADDNASGTSGLIELLDAFTRLPAPPRRSVLFALWDGEEKGLLGSKHFTANPTIGLDKIVFVYNMDMIGRLTSTKGIEAWGTRTTPALRQLISRENAMFKTKLTFPWKVKDNSDHHPFFSKGIPFLMLHTGLHGDYHRPRDDAHKINSEGMEKITRLAFNVLHDVADRTEPITFRRASRYEGDSDKERLERSVAPVQPRLGVWWDDYDNQPGLKVTRLAADSAARKGGMRPGDRIVKFAGRDVSGPDPFRLQVLAVKNNPVSMVVQRPGEPEPVRLSIELSGPPIRVGVSWRMDPAEPGTATLVQVVTGSAAAQAGLARKDRVYEVNGRKIERTEQLQSLLKSSPSPLEFLIERGGRLHTVEVPVSAR